MNTDLHLQYMNLFTSHKPYIIAGPCSAENESQMLSIAEGLKALPVDMIRAGVWKPRSKPGYFEGMGELALPWLNQIQAITQKPVCIEVANTQQVELALKYKLDAVWIGARTTVNPFVVQELCDAIKGSNIAVLVKNPINPDVELWSGAIERFMRIGISDIAAIHRGFSSYDNTSKYRNKPMWALPIELKRRYKDLPVFCDPSHIGGKRELIAPISQRALDLDFDGLMIEVHPTPDTALSDASQQVTPETLKEILQHLILRKPTVDSDTEIENIRLVLDSMDAEIVDIIGKRMEVVKKLAQIKEKYNMPIFQQDRWCEIVDSRNEWGQANDLNPEFILQLFQLIHDKSIKTQFDSLKK
jgi:chorismate mutase